MVERSVRHKHKTERNMKCIKKPNLTVHKRFLNRCANIGSLTVLDMNTQGHTDCQIFSKIYIYCITNISCSNDYFNNDVYKAMAMTPALLHIKI